LRVLRVHRLRSSGLCFMCWSVPFKAYSWHTAGS